MKRLPFATVLVLVAACDSYEAPAGPSVSTPVPAPSAPLPVPAENAIYLAAPPRQPNSATEPIVGRYTLEITTRSSSGLRCQAVPEHAKRRLFTADIDPFRDYYSVSLYEATFLKDGRSVRYGCSDRRLEMGGVCHQFIMRRDGDETVTIEMVPEDEWRGSEIWEVLIQEGRLLQLYGRASGTAREGRIEATGTGGVWYGNGLPASDFSGCGPDGMSLTFTRR